MGPKRSDNATKGNKSALSATVVLSTVAAGVTTTEQEQQHCTGKFVADLELCCREPPPGYPVPIPVFIRGHGRPTPPPVPMLSQMPSNPSQSQLQQQQHAGYHSGMSATPSVLGGINEEQYSPAGKKTSRSRVLSAGQTGIIIGVTGADSDSRPESVLEPEPSKVSSSPYKTFQLLEDSEFFRPKLLVDSAAADTEPIDQITALYMRAWQLDQRFLEILKRVLPLQEQLHTLNFSFVGLNPQTTADLVDLCQGIKNLKSVSLDGNPLVSAHFHLLIDKEDSKIVHLSLRYCQITDTGVEPLARALGHMSKQNWKLLTLDLSGNGIGDNGAESLATALRYNRTLTSLNLSSNLITDRGGVLLALVLRKIVLAPEEVVRRRFILAERYAAAHPDDWRYTTSSPTPSTVSAKSKSGRVEWKRLTDPNKKKLNPSKIAQIMVDKRNRPESGEHSPPTGRQSDLKRGRNEGSAGNRTAAQNVPSAGGNTSRRGMTGSSNSNGKDSDQPRVSGPARVKKIAAAMNATAKKTIPAVKEEVEDTTAQEGLDYLRILFDFVEPSVDASVLEQLTSAHKRLIDRDNPLLETTEIETHDGQIWLRGNFALISLNLSRNHLTVDTVKEFLLSMQHQSVLSRFNDVISLASAAPAAALVDFCGLCRLELRGMSDISTQSPEYQSLEAVLSQKNPAVRFHQFREREAKELLDSQSAPAPLQLQPTVPEKSLNPPEKTRTGHNLKSLAQRPTPRSKD